MMDRIQIFENILNANDEVARQNRERLDVAGVFSLNLMASPGAGKTSLIEQTVHKLKDKLKIAIIDGDIATDLDINRAIAAGADAYQINTGGECHLDAIMLRKGLDYFYLTNFDLLIVENVGNLVCPANFRLGTHKNILISSIPEGDDKPYKYPGIFRSVDTLIINKIDLLPYVQFNIDYFKKGVKMLNPDVNIIPLSCVNGEGIDIWITWINNQIGNNKNT